MDIIPVWRICHQRHRDSAFTGEGARLFGARFNSEGIDAVYTSGSLSLSLLEVLVQTNDRSYLQYCVIFRADIPASIIDVAEKEDLPDGWDKIPHGHASQQFGDRWIRSGTSPVLRIPSVVVPVEYNYVLNPNHSDFEHIQVTQYKDAVIDPRLFATELLNC